VERPPYALDDAALLAQCQQQTLRGGGPGGQHANRTESGVRLVHALGVTAESRTHREQPRNRAEALRTLRVRLACTLRGQSDPAWLEPHRRGGRLLAGPNAQDWPCLAAVLLDALAEQAGELGPAAAGLELTTSQLVKALTSDGDVHQAVNALRAAHGKGPVHGR
jgi:hypothetical protein